MAVSTDHKRAAHEELGLFTWQETEEAYKEVFAKIEGLEVEQKYLDVLNFSSYGHPYLMQLLGYYLIVHVNEKYKAGLYEVVEADVENAVSDAMLSYEDRALKPLMDELPNSERRYLSAMSGCLNDDRLASTADIAKSLNTHQNKLSKIRANLIDNGIIAAPERGYLMFCIPYLADYVDCRYAYSGCGESPGNIRYFWGFSNCAILDIPDGKPLLY